MACRSLGFGKYIKFVTGEKAKLQGEGRIWLDNVNCTSRGLDISGCSHEGWGKHNCGHSEDVVLYCDHT